MHKRFGKNDAVFLGILLGLCLLVFLGYRVFLRTKGSRIVITKNGEVYGTYSLEKEQTIEIKDKDGTVTNTLIIKDQKADMESADCPDRLCVKQKAISLENENIVCLPNKVVVTVVDGDASDFDAIAQ